MTDRIYPSQALGPGSSPTFSGLTLSGLTAGRLVYTGVGGLISASANGLWDGTNFSVNGKLSIGQTAGAGPSITAGTATTDVAALSVTRTNNNAAVATGVKFAFTDTTSAAGFLPFQVLGGAAAATNLLSVDKAGNISATSYTVDGSSSVSMSNGSGYLTLRNISGGNGVGASAAGNDIGSAGYFSANATTFTLNSGVAFGWTASASDARTGTAKDTSISRVSAGVLGVGTGAAGSVAGTISAAAYISGGSAGVDFGPAAVTSITVKKGIITAIS